MNIVKMTTMVSPVHQH